MDVRGLEVLLQSVRRPSYRPRLANLGVRAYFNGRSTEFLAVLVVGGFRH